jgi:hypothetical protein
MQAQGYAQGAAAYAGAATGAVAAAGAGADDQRKPSYVCGSQYSLERDLLGPRLAAARSGGLRRSRPPPSHAPVLCRPRLIPLPRPSPVCFPFPRRAPGCGKVNHLDVRGQVRCTHCGYRIFYKVRTNRITQFDAR